MDRRVLVLALAVYVTGNYEHIRGKRSYLVFFTGRKTGLMVKKLFDKYGIPYDAKLYRNKVRDKVYWRYKIIVRDPELIRKTKEFLEEKKEKLKWYITHYIRLAREVFSVFKRGRGWARVEELLGVNALKKLFGIKPFTPHIYRVFKNKKLARLLKPRWRFYSFIRYLVGRYGAEVLYRLADRYRWAVINMPV